MYGVLVNQKDLETVKESRKILNCHFDLQLVPTDPVGTFLYCEETDIITQKTQNCYCHVEIIWELFTKKNQLTS